MWFDARAALARIEGGTHPAPETLGGLNSQNSQDSQPPAAKARNPASGRAQAQFIGSAMPQPQGRVFAQYARKAQPDPDADTFRHGASVAGNPLTWTGRIVSLDDWRRLTEWERHGPNGRHRCALCRCWHPPEKCFERS